MRILQPVCGLTNPALRKRRRPIRRPRPGPVPRPTPAAAWASWTDDDRWEPNDRPGRQFDLSAFALASPDEPGPTPRAVAWNDAFAHGYALEDAAPPAEMDDAIALSWWAGYDAGQVRRRQDDARIDRLEDGAREPHHAELVEGAGVGVARGLCV